MIQRFIIFIAIGASLVLAQQQERVVGAVESVTAAAQELTIRTDAGKTVTGHIADKCRLMRVEPGEKDLSKAAPMEFSAVAVGDRVIARGMLADDKLSVTTLVVMSKTSLAEKNAKEQAEWRTRGVRGVVKAVNTAGNEIQISTGSNGTAKEWTVSVPAAAVLRRYADGSVKFSDSQVAPLSAIEVGDQLRVLGTKDEAASKIVAEQVVSGSFRTLGGEVISIKAESGEMTMKDVQTKKPVVIRMTADTRIRRMPNFGGGAGGGMMRPGGMNGGAERPAGAGMQAGGMARGPGGPMGGGRTPDLAQMVERLPAATLADVKPGDAVIVSVAKPAGAGAANAITMVAGVDFLLRASAAQVNQTLGNWNTEMSMPGQ
ncbi:hypothetical protein [uncultured Paludibaculum sp.]|uniref:hypothetical protein n=1 Tax=uncultured Paludibaculum sp. TaxID=1765020 RepID=UPI002AAB6EFE|nr:hypothetical protein [uncultured Paludibaculum sp.]